MATEKRLIDANALLHEYCQANGCNEVNDEICPNCFTAGLVANAPTVDAMGVVHGRWEQIGYDKAMDRISCSVCKEHWNIMDNDTDTFNYCPHCGAKMDGDGNGK